MTHRNRYERPAEFDAMLKDYVFDCLFSTEILDKSVEGGSLMTTCGTCKYWHEYKLTHWKLRRLFGRMGICRNRKSDNHNRILNPLYGMCGDHEGKGIKE